MTTFKKGDHLQQVGGYAGIAFDGKTWIKYECSGCALASGLILSGQRLPIGGRNTRLWDKYFRNAHTTVFHDRELHNAWLTAGRPLPFNH